MLIEEKKRLMAINRDFYRHFASEFAATRAGFWLGWERLLPLVRACGRAGVAARVLDVAAGNLRFKKFLDEKVVQYSNYLGIDGEVSLLRSSTEPERFWSQVDILAELAAGRDWREVGEHDFVICSAFLHHVPGQDWREKILSDLVELVAEGGYLVVTWWRFLAGPKIARKLIQDLGEGDYLLSWQNDQQHPRYCHNFSESEIKEIKQLMLNKGLVLCDEFFADGETGSDNHYLVWQKKTSDLV